MNLSTVDSHWGLGTRLSTLPVLLGAIFQLSLHPGILHSRGKSWDEALDGLATSLCPGCQWKEERVSGETALAGAPRIGQGRLSRIVKIFGY